MKTTLSDLNEVARPNDPVVIRVKGGDYLINHYYVDRGQLVLETSKFNIDDGSDVTEDDIVS